ncbi:hypothetical protein AVEN_72883-1 [Araneus ventricosus]|uniref:Uncharacterized protein n=1 Tax=Araneus ventricosus TaxID=182803 RepID=A0A4Y2HX80_ARAVE|nr:hypothetical protein AVEN_264499-1 [Araneus ventricosus]GBM69566.1 hypothetical protein AVEN_72883-1 [Araneus ventricosus]
MDGLKARNSRHYYPYICEAYAHGLILQFARLDVKYKLLGFQKEARSSRDRTRNFQCRPETIRHLLTQDCQGRILNVVLPSRIRHQDARKQRTRYLRTTYLQNPGLEVAMPQS